MNYVGSDVDNFQWSMMLRSISSFRAFKWAYGEEQINYINKSDSNHTIANFKVYYTDLADFQTSSLLKHFMCFENIF